MSVYDTLLFAVGPGNMVAAAWPSDWRRFMTLPLDRLPQRPRFWRSRAFADAVWIFVFSSVFFFVAVQVEASDYVRAFAERYERWQVDEFLTTLMVLPFVLVVYAIRRLIDARSELARRTAAELTASNMAQQDALTGLPNRRKAHAELARALAKASDRPITLMAVDLNRFKPVNDLYGHAVGDELLQAVGQRLVKAAGPSAIVSRLGGDEFCVQLEDCTSDDLRVARTEAISSVFDRPFELSQVTVTVGASIGVAATDDPDMNMDALMAQADAAMYRSKASGRNGFGFFEAGMELAALRRAKIEAELRRALEEDRIEAHFQPLVRLADREVIGFEALARWRLRDGDYRFPDEFISIAEETGLISDVFFAVLKHAARTARNWPATMRFATNVSAVQFNDPWLVERILQTLIEEGVTPGRLEIEVTEAALLADFELARNVIWSMKNQGIHVSLDDFGTGYSSLRHLSELPFETLKIDRSYIEKLSKDPAAQTIVRTVTSMAHNLGLKVTAEGIETESNARNVTAFGCDIGQGFLYGRPRAAAGPAAKHRLPAPEIEPDTLMQPGRRRWRA